MLNVKAKKEQLSCILPIVQTVDLSLPGGWCFHIKKTHFKFWDQGYKHFTISCNSSCHLIEEMQESKKGFHLGKGKREFRRFVAKSA